MTELQEFEGGPCVQRTPERFLRKPQDIASFPCVNYLKRYFVAARPKSVCLVSIVS